MPRSACLFFLMGILLAAACTKEQAKDQPKSQVNPPPPASAKTDIGLLQGQWQWVEQTQSPEAFGPPDTSFVAVSLGITRYLNLNADSTWSLVSNGLTIGSGTYKIDSALTPDGFVPMLDLAHDGKDSLLNHWFGSNNDSLYTFPPQVPPFIQDTYVRIVGL